MAQLMLTHSMTYQVFDDRYYTTESLNYHAAGLSEHFPSLAVLLVKIAPEINYAK